MKLEKVKAKKKIVAMILLVLTLFSVVQPVFAASGSGTFTAGQYDSGIQTTDHTGSVGILIRRLINLDTGERMTVFCAEHGTDFETGAIEDGGYYTPTTPELKKACKIAYFGWYSKHGSYVIDGGILAGDMYNVKMDYVFTQQYIWEVLGQSSATFKNSSIQSQYNSFKATINQQINDMAKQPSFVGTTIELEAGETKTITDTNNVLKDYNSIDKTVDGLRFVHNKGENTITITVNQNCNVENYRVSDTTMKEWGMIKDGTQDNDTTIYFTFPDGVQDQLYSLHYNDPVTMSLSLKINLLGNLELSKLNTNGDLVDGAKFRVTGPNNFNQLVTVKDGKITLEKIRRGTYTIREEGVPEGYLINTETYKVEVKPNETATQVIVNDEPTGQITIIKRDSETGSVAQGDATFLNAKYEVYANEDIYNVAKTKKYYSKGDLVATRTMSEQGTTEDIEDLPLGKYLVKEVISSEGYLLDTKEYDINLEYENQTTPIISETVTSNEVVKKMQIHIFKSGIDEQSGVVDGLEGAEFTIKLASDVEEAYNKGYSYAEVWNGIDEYGNKVDVDEKRVSEAQTIAPTYDTLVTDSDGNAYSAEKLPYGRYIGKETKTPQDFETASDFTFSITKDESEIQEVAQKVKDIIINNEQLETYVKLVKKDKDTGKIVTLNNATFQIKAAEDIYDRGNGKILYKKGEVIKQKVGSTVYDSFTTNADNIIVPDNSYNNSDDEQGTVITPLMLEVGSYEISEILIPKGFLQLEEPVVFKIEGIRDYDKDEQGDYIKTVVIENEQPTGTVIVDKSVAIREDVDTSLVDISDMSGIKFKLTAKEDIISPIDGSVIYKAGQEVGTYNLSKEGNLEINDIPMGIYELQEIQTLDGLVLNNKKYEVKFTQKDTVTKIYEENLDIENDTTLVEFSKTDITGEKELENAELTVTDKDNNVIDKWVSTNETHKIEGLKAGETYTLREEYAPDGYVQASEIQFTVENTNEIQKVEMIDKIVEILKTDVDGNAIEGVSLVLTNTRTKNIVDKWTTTKEPHRVSGLIEGETYILHEEKAVGDFVKAQDIEFTVTEDKETQTITMIDKTVEVSKTDFVTGEEIEGAELKVVDENGNTMDSWTSTKTPHKVKGLEEGKTYKLIETLAPYGYELTNEIEFTVTSEKEIQKIEMKDMPILQTVQLVKKDSNTNEIIKDKFTFGLYEDQECTKLIKSVESDKKFGTVTFSDLRYGTYFIKEENSPNGYVLSDKVIKLEINDKGIFIDGEKIEGENDIYSFDFYNTPVDTPKTGDNSKITLWAGLLGLSILTLAGIGVREYKKRKYVNKQ